MRIEINPNFPSNFKSHIVGGGAYDAPQKRCRRRAVPYDLKFKLLDKSEFEEVATKKTVPNRDGMLFLIFHIG